MERLSDEQRAELKRECQRIVREARDGVGDAEDRLQFRRAMDRLDRMREGA